MMLCSAYWHGQEQRSASASPLLQEPLFLKGLLICHSLVAQQNSPASYKYAAIDPDSVFDLNTSMILNYKG